MDIQRTWSSSTRPKVTTGTDFPLSDVKTFSYTRPFIRQLDLILSGSDAIPAARESLSSLNGFYGKGSGSLADIVKNYPSGQEVSLLPYGSQEDDTWAIDNRGALTIFVTKSTYEQLGATGEKLPFKSSTSKYVIRFSLRPNAYTPANKARMDKAVKKLDEIRGRPWEVSFSSVDPSSKESISSQSLGLANVTIESVALSSQELKDVHVPNVRITPFQKGNLDEEENWHESISELFEWTGMVAFGSPRLLVANRPDPYVSLYDPPDDSVAGTATHIVWRGFMCPAFIEKVLKTALSHSTTSFLSLSAHSHLTAPISYIPSTKMGQGEISASVRDPSARNQEDTWSLFLSNDGTTRKWLLADVAGALDARFG